MLNSLSCRTSFLSMLFTFNIQVWYVYNRDLFTTCGLCLKVNDRRLIYLFLISWCDNLFYLVVCPATNLKNLNITENVWLYLIRYFSANDNIINKILFTSSTTYFLINLLIYYNFIPSLLNVTQKHVPIHQLKSTLERIQCHPGNSWNDMPG